MTASITVELHSSGLIGKASHPVMQKTPIIGFVFDNKLHRQFAVRMLLFTIYRVSQEECARLREGVPYVKVYGYNPKQLCPKLNGYGDSAQ